MTTKKQKRLAGELRAQERDAQHQAEIKARTEAAKRRADRKLKREAEQQRHAATLEAMRKLRGGQSA